MFLRLDPSTYLNLYLVDRISVVEDHIVFYFPDGREYRTSCPTVRKDLLTGWVEHNDESAKLRDFDSDAWEAKYLSKHPKRNLFRRLWSALKG